MRRGHLLIIFGILMTVLFISALNRRTAYKQALEEKKNIDYALQMSADSAAEILADTYPNTNLSDYLTSASDAFFESMIAALNLYEDEDKAEELTYFIPAIVVTTADGFYVNYLSETHVESSIELERIWTECQPYSYSDDYFIYRFFFDDQVFVYEKATGSKTESSLEEIMNDERLRNDFSVGKVFISEESYYEYKRAAIAESIARVLDRTMNEHGKVAGQVGISTIYSVPEFLSNYSPAQEYPSFIAMFQGYPLTSDARIIYNGSSTSASFISTVTRYTVEVSTGPAQPFSVFHKDGCVTQGTYGKILAEKYSQKEAVSLFGAYACPYCFFDEDSVPILP